MLTPDNYRMSKTFGNRIITRAIPIARDSTFRALKKELTLQV